jgi:hypothetical protein
MKKELPTKEYVESLLDYDAETGELRWKVERSNQIRVGQLVTSSDSKGYIRVTINGRRHQVHRIAWLLVHGEWPVEEVDHINMVTSDNRISNLRACSHSENRRNTNRYRNNSSGIKGVSWNSASNSWLARLAVNGKNIYAGSFKNLGDAERAVAKLREQYHGSFANHGGKN